MIITWDYLKFTRGSLEFHFNLTSLDSFQFALRPGICCKLPRRWKQLAVIRFLPGNRSVVGPWPEPIDQPMKYTRCKSTMYHNSTSTQYVSDIVPHLGRGRVSERGESVHHVVFKLELCDKMWPIRWGRKLTKRYRTVIAIAIEKNSNLCQASKRAFHRVTNQNRNMSIKVLSFVFFERAYLSPSHRRRRWNLFDSSWYRYLWSVRLGENTGPHDRNRIECVTFKICDIRDDRIRVDLRHGRLKVVLACRARMRTRFKIDYGIVDGLWTVLNDWLKVESKKKMIEK